MKLYTLSPKLREVLKAPLGTLIKDDQLSKAKLEPLLSGKIIVCVGDRTTETLREFGFIPSLEIIDLVERRQSRSAPTWNGSPEHFLKVENPAGSISSEALSSLASVRDLIVKNPNVTVRIQVSGEEDLLVLPVLAFFPDNVIVLYGQPLEGLVLVSVNDSRKNARNYLGEMGVRSLSEKEVTRLTIFEMLKSPRAAIRQNAVLIKFMTVGASGVVVGLILLTILKMWLHPAVANTISVELTIVSNFILNDVFTFRHTRQLVGGRSNDRLHRLLKYNLVSLAGLAVNSGVFYVLNYIRIYYVWSYLIAVLAAFMLNYFGSSRWAWRSVLE